MLDGTEGNDPFEDGQIREDIIARALGALLEDAKRCDGSLKRADVDRTYVKKHLTISECEHVERALLEAGVAILDTERDEDDASSSPAEAAPQTRQRFLTEQEERDLGRKIQLAAQIEREGRADSDFARRALHDAQEARTRFVESNIRYVWKLAWEKGPRQHLTVEDLFQEGMIGLLRATEGFDPDRGFRFKTYATWWIEQKMFRAIANDDRMVRLPVHLRDQIARVRRAEKLLALEIGRPPTEREVATALGVDVERLVKLKMHVHETTCLEADAPIGDGDATIVSSVPDGSVPSPFDVVAAQQTRKNIRRVLNDLLTPREENVLRLRFGLDRRNNHTLETIGILYGVTRERIRQIEAKALRKLKHPAQRRMMSFYFGAEFGD
jgi:RNA polymerase primary sigma factor